MWSLKHSWMSWAEATEMKNKREEHRKQQKEKLTEWHQHNIYDKDINPYLWDTIERMVPQVYQSNPRVPTDSESMFFILSGKGRRNQEPNRISHFYWTRTTSLDRLLKVALIKVFILVHERWYMSTLPLSYQPVGTSDYLCRYYSNLIQAREKMCNSSMTFWRNQIKFVLSYKPFWTFKMGITQLIMMYIREP